jgi:hypothetical protein
MKQLLTLTLTLTLFMVCHAQTAQFDRVSGLSVNQIPRYNSLTNATAAGSRPGNIVFVYDGADSGVHVRSFDNSRWIKINAGGGGGGGSYSAGNGIKIEDDVIRWADTLQNQVVYLMDNALNIPALDLKVLDNSWLQMGTDLDNGRFSYFTQQHNQNDFGGGVVSMVTSSGIVANERVSASINVIGQLYNSPGIEIGVTKNNIPGRQSSFGGLLLQPSLDFNDSVITEIKMQFDSIKLSKFHFNTPYAPTTTSTDKYKVVLMDSITGALVTTSPAVVKRQPPGTPTGTSDTQGEAGDMLYDDSYLYIKTSVGWKRVSLSTF